MRSAIALPQRRPRTGPSACDRVAPAPRQHPGALLERDVLPVHRPRCNAEHQANATYEAYRARGAMKDGRRFGGPPTPYEPPATPAGKINVTDLDCRPMKARRGFIQGYNPQAVVNADRVILAAELGTRSPDFGLIGPTVTAALAELDAVGMSDVPGSCSLTPATGIKTRWTSCASSTASRS